MLDKLVSCGMFFSSLFFIFFNLWVNKEDKETCCVIVKSTDKSSTQTQAHLQSEIANPNKYIYSANVGIRSVVRITKTKQKKIQLN